MLGFLLLGILSLVSGFIWWAILIWQNVDDTQRRVFLDNLPEGIGCIVLIMFGYICFGIVKLVDGD